MLKAKWDRSKGRPEPIRLLNRIPEVENGEPLVDLRTASPSVVIMREQVIPFLRQSVAAMLEDAAHRLPERYQIGVIDAWRPFDRQRRIYEMMKNWALEVWPDLTYPQLKRKLNRYVAPVDQKAPPGHCTGAAVDVFLLDAIGEIIDVSAPYTRFSAAATYSLGLTGDAAAARSLLVDAMLGAGFSNCRDEWWHYSWGDAGWAVRMNQAECVYGLVELSPELFARQEELWVEAMKDRPNPFLS